MVPLIVLYLQNREKIEDLQGELQITYYQYDIKLKRVDTGVRKKSIKSFGRQQEAWSARFSFGALVAVL